MGSMRAARRAGSQLEPMATAAMVAVMAVKTTGSSGRTPTSRLATPCAKAKASSSPIAHARAGQPSRPLENHAQYILAPRAHGQAHADLAGAFAHQVGHDGEDADGRQKQGDQPIHAQHPGCIHQAGQVFLQITAVGF
jgi:hypothetical protein